MFCSTARSRVTPVLRRWPIVQLPQLSHENFSDEGLPLQANAYARGRRPNRRDVLLARLRLLCRRGSTTRTPGVARRTPPRTGTAAPPRGRDPWQIPTPLPQAVSRCPDV